MAPSGRSQRARYETLPCGACRRECPRLTGGSRAGLRAQRQHWLRHRL